MHITGPIHVLKKIDEQIDQLEIELEELNSKLPQNYLAWPKESITLIEKKQAKLGYLRSNAKTEVLADYCVSIVNELNRIETKKELTRISCELGRLKTSQEKYWTAVHKGQELVASKPAYFSEKSSYLDLARRVCKELSWSAKRVRSVRRNLQDANVIPNPDKT